MTISQESVIESVQQKLLSEGFLAYEKIRLGKRLDSGLTLHEVIRRSVGMKDGDSTYMYWEWRELKPSLDAMWTALDEAASRVEGRRTTAIAFCSPDSRSRDEVLRMLESVHVIETNSIPSVTRRPTKSEAQVRFTGKLLGAILMAMGTLELTRDSGFGDLFSSLSGKVVSNEQLLAEIDDQLKLEIVNLELAKPPQTVVILRALGWALQNSNEIRLEEELRPLTLSEFFLETDASSNWSGMSDKVVLRRLLEMAPKDGSEASLKAIDKFLTE